MHALPYIVAVFFEGLFVGAIARLLLPGPDPMGIAFTATVGVFGSFVGGMFAWFVFGHHGWGLGIAFVIAVLFTMLFLWLLRFMRSGGGSRRTMGGGPMGG